MSAPPENDGSRIKLGSIPPPPPPRESPRRGINDTSAIFGKRHGRSSGMRHGWRSSWSGVRFPVRLSVQGPVGEVPATTPFSIPLHHRYRRWIGGVSRPHSFLSSCKVCLFLTVWSLSTGSQQKAKPQPQHTCSSALHHRGRLRRRNRITSSYSSSARNRTFIFRAAAGCIAAAVHGPQKAASCTPALRNALSERMVCTRGWVCGPLTATLSPQFV